MGGVVISMAISLVGIYVFFSPPSLESIVQTKGAHVRAVQLTGPGKDVWLPVEAFRSNLNDASWSQSYGGEKCGDSYTKLDGYLYFCGHSRRYVYGIYYAPESAWFISDDYDLDCLKGYVVPNIHPADIWPVLGRYTNEVPVGLRPSFITEQNNPTPVDE